MSKDAPTLADAFLRESFRPCYKQVDPERKLPKMVAKARRFILDDSMSAFMADLAWASIMTCANSAKAQLLLDGMRSLARLPHKLTWIEYNGTAKARRSSTEYGSRIVPELVPAKMGWLCGQHEGIDTAFWALEFASHAYKLDGVTQFKSPQAFPFAYGWRSDDEGPLPWHRLTNTFMDKNTLERTNALNAAKHPEAVLIGVPAYHCSNVAMISSPAGNAALNAHLKRSTFNLAAEIAGDLRYLWALLATINDIPTSVSDVTASKGFIARGRYRKFVDYKVIKLHVPEKRYRRIACQAIAISRRRAHQVRGHWRRDWRNAGERIWIHEHQRGDASLGFVTHDYTVTHERAGQ